MPPFEGMSPAQEAPKISPEKRTIAYGRVVNSQHAREVESLLNDSRRADTLKINGILEAINRGDLSGAEKIAGASAIAKPTMEGNFDPKELLPDDLSIEAALDEIGNQDHKEGKTPLNPAEFN